MFFFGNNEKKLVVPRFSGPTKNGGKVFKATPQLINTHNNKVARSNIILVMFGLVFLLLGLIISYSVRDISNQDTLLVYIGDFLVFISFIMIVLFVMLLPYNISTYNNKMSKIYLEVTSSGIKGITIDEDEEYVFFDVEYSNIVKIVYNSRQLSIYCKDGRFYDYGVFYNPHEVYSTIVNMSDSDFDFTPDTP